MNKAREEQQKLFENEESGDHVREEKREKEKLDCVFCAIVKGNLPARHIVFGDNTSIAILDKKPVFLGHSLLIPRNHYETLYDLPEDLVAPIFSNVQLLARAIESGLSAKGTFVAINNKISQSIPHLHVHVIPRRPGDGLRGFFWPRQEYQSEQQMSQIAEAIKESLKKIRAERNEME